MKYQFVVVTHEGPSLMTHDEFESWISVLISKGIVYGVTELLDELPFDYEDLEPHQAAFMYLWGMKVDLETGGWNI